MILLAMMAAFFAALAGVLICTVMSLQNLARALNKVRPKSQRLTAAALCVIFAIGAVASVSAGFWGIGYLSFVTFGGG